MPPGKRSSLWPSLMVALCPLVLVAATCKSDEKPKSVPTPLAAATPAATDKPAEAGEKAKDAPAELDFKKFGLQELTPSAKDQIRQVASDEFCYCGCPHTLGGCLQVHPECSHAKRMLMLAASEAQAGGRASDILRDLQKYYGSFKKEKRGAIDLADVPCMGNEKAPVTMVEFSDFECPFCGAARPMLESFVEAHKDKVRLCYKNFPLQSHQHSLAAAQAAEYARSQGKFWEFHDLLFENQLAMSMEEMKAHAKKVGIDPAAMEKAVTSETFLPKVNASKEEGKKLGIDSTPSLFINGRPLVLPIAAGSLKHAVDDELEYLKDAHWQAD